LLPFAALLLTVAVTAMCAPSIDAAVRGGAVDSFRNDFLVFRYPSAWTSYEFPLPGSLHFHPMVYVSTQPGHNPCRQRANATICGWPIERLRANGVLIVWENRGMPGWSLASAPGRAVRVGGRSAKSAIARPGVCSSIGADETVQVAIGRSNSNWTAFTACLRGPDLAARKREVDALLASTRFLTP
jgi:hypothetical protein